MFNLQYTKYIYKTIALNSDKFKEHGWYHHIAIKFTSYAHMQVFPSLHCKYSNKLSVLYRESSYSSKHFSPNAPNVIFPMYVISAV